MSESKEGALLVSRTVKGKESSHEEKIEIRPFKTDTATITVKAGATVNMGNYESARVDISLSLPCYVEEIEDVFSFAKDFVDTKMSQEYEELREASNG